MNVLEALKIDQAQLWSKTDLLSWKQILELLVY